MYVGSFSIDDLLTFYANSHTPGTGAAVDADAAPGYRVYEDETGTPILTGSMALLDDTNTVGFYSEQITLSAANGFEIGKSYCIRVTIVVGGVTGTLLYTLQVKAPAVSGSDVTAIKAITDAIGATAAARLALSMGASPAGTVDNAGFSPTTTEFEASNITEATADHYVGRVVLFTSGAMLGQAASIVDYSLVSGRGHFTVSLMTESPANGVTFIII